MLAHGFPQLALTFPILKFIFINTFMSKRLKHVKSRNLYLDTGRVAAFPNPICTYNGFIDLKHLKVKRIPKATRKLLSPLQIFPCQTFRESEIILPQQCVHVRSATEPEIPVVSLP